LNNAINIAIVVTSEANISTDEENIMISLHTENDGEKILRIQGGDLKPYVHHDKETMVNAGTGIGVGAFQSWQNYIKEVWFWK
jgi:hypothetical protein